MGRAKREVPTGKLFLKYPKKGYDNNKEYTLFFYYSWDRKTMTKDTQYRVRVKDWNEKANNGRGALCSTYGSDYKRCNNQLEETLRNIDGMIREYHAQHPHGLNPQVIHDILNGKPLTQKDGGRDFIAFVKENLYNRYTQNRIGKSRYENGLSAMNGFREYLRANKRGTYQTDSIYLGEISGELLDDYITYRKEIKKNRASTINHALTPIIEACEQASLRGYISDRVYAEIKDKRLAEDTSLIDEEKFDGKYLTKEQLKQLAQFYEQDTEPRRKEYIEMFLFAFHACGLRMVDVLTLEWRHIDFDRKEMKKVLIKTAKFQKQRHTVPLTDAALKILKRWKDMGRRTRFVFDLLRDDVDIANQEIRYKERNSVTKKVNQALHVVGEKMGLPFTLSFHVARHSFAINALNDEHHPLDMYQVSRLLGHSSTDVTEKVYADYTREYLEDKLRELNYDFLPDFESNKD